MSPHKSAQRNKRGITVAELVAMLPLLTILGFGGACLVASLGLLQDYKMKLAYVAQAGAQVYVNTSQWQGAKRPGVDAEQVVSNTIQECATQMGLGTVKSSISVSPDNPNSDGVTYLTVTVSGASPLLPFARAIGTISNVSESVTFAYGNQNPIALAYVVGEDTPKDPDLDGPGGILMPSYGGGLDYDPNQIVNNMIIQVPAEQQLEYYGSSGGYRPL